jgi:hypothetical protein
MRKISFRSSEMLMQLGHVVRIKLPFIIALIFILCAFSSPAIADWSKYEVLGKGEDPGIPGDYIWTIKNQCNESIRLAINFTTGWGRTITKGWKYMQPQSEFALKMNSEYIGYHAVSISNRYYWWDSKRPYFGVNLDRDFEYASDGLRQGPTKVQFVWISIIEEPVTTLICP